MSAQIRSRSLYVAGLCALLGAAACTDDNPVSPSRGLAPRAAQREISVSNPAIALLSVEVGGGKSEQKLLYNVPIVDGRSKDALSTPAGEGRELVVRGYDVYGTLTHQGSAFVEGIRVGRNEPLSLTLTPTGEGKGVKVYLDVVGEELLGGGSIVVEAPKELLEGQKFSLKATVYDREGRRIDVDPSEIHWAVSDPRVGRIDIDQWSGRWFDASYIGKAQLIAIHREIVFKWPILTLADPYVQIAAGFDFTCGLRLSGAVFCWGGNGTSQLGTTATQASCFIASTNTPCIDHPVAVSGGRIYSSISSGRSFVCGIETSGKISCWGKNDFGQLGIGSKGAPVATPGSVNSALTFTTLSSGGDHSCAIANSPQKAAFCWGWNSIGQLGDNDPGYFGPPTPQEKTSPVAVFGGLAWKSIGAGSEHTCGVTTTGTAMCWGSNYVGEIGVGPFVSVRPRPDTVNTMISPAFNSTFSGPNAYGTCWLRVGALASCQGANDSGQVATGFLSAPNTGIGQPASLAFLTPPGPSFVTIALGAKHDCAIDNGDNLWCWGGNSQGQLGFSIYTWSYLFRPKQVGTYKFMSVTAGGSHTCALTRSGDVFCWGRNDRGQLGIGSHGTSTPTPTQVVP